MSTKRQRQRPTKARGAKLSGLTSRLKVRTGVHFRPRLAVLFLRVATGAYFFHAGYTRLTDPLFVNRFPSEMAGLAANNPFFVVQDLIHYVVLPNAWLFATLLIYLELAIGVGLILGLFFPWVVGAELFLALNFLMASQHRHPSEGLANLALIGVGFTLWLAQAGQLWGLDQWIGRLKQGRTSTKGFRSKGGGSHSPRKVTLTRASRKPSAEPTRKSQPRREKSQRAREQSRQKANLVPLQRPTRQGQEVQASKASLKETLKALKAKRKATRKQKEARVPAPKKPARGRSTKPQERSYEDEFDESDDPDDWDDWHEEDFDYDYEDDERNGSEKEIMVANNPRFEDLTGD